MAEKRKVHPPNDVAQWGEKDTSGAYPPGTKFELADGSKVDVNAVPDHLGGKAGKPSNKRPRRSSQ